MNWLIILCFMPVAQAMLEIKGFPGNSSVQEVVALIHGGTTSFSTPWKQPTVQLGWKIPFSNGAPLAITNLDKGVITNNALDEAYERIGNNKDGPLPTAMEGASLVKSLDKFLRLRKLDKSQRCDAYINPNDPPVYIYDNGEHYFKKDVACSSLDSISAYSSPNVINKCLIEPFKNAIMCSAFLSTRSVVGFSEGSEPSNNGESQYILVKQTNARYVHDVLPTIAAIAKQYGDLISVYPNVWFMKNVVTTKGDNGLSEIKYGIKYPGSPSTFTPPPGGVKTTTIIDGSSTITSTSTSTSTSSTSSSTATATPTATGTPTTNPVEKFVASKAPNAKLDVGLNQWTDCSTSRRPGAPVSIMTSLNPTDKVPPAATKYAYKKCTGDTYNIVFEVPPTVSGRDLGSMPVVRPSDT